MYETTIIIITFIGIFTLCHMNTFVISLMELNEKKHCFFVEHHYK